MIENKAEEIWKEYQQGKAYQSAIGLNSVIPLCVDFYEGKQWGSVKEGTENFPRPMVNFVKMIVDNKRANLMSSPLKIVYKSSNPNSKSEDFNNFAEYWQKEAQMKYLDSEAIKAGIIKGTYVYHYYWDNEAIGRKGKVDGALRCQLIDVRNVVFSNPQEKDEQKQEWIIIASRATLKSVRDKLSKKELKESVTADSEVENGEIDQEGTKMVTVLTKYYRKNGQVYFVKSTKNVMLTEESSLAPDYNKAIKIIEEKLGEGTKKQEVDSTNATPDNPEDKPQISEYKAIYYPVVVGVYEEREGSIYGIGEVAGLINNQKAVNNILALQAYSTEENALGKIVVKEDALGDQEIDNRPGQIIHDYSKLHSQGIYRLPDPQLSTMPLTEIETIISLSRSVTGSTEVISGEVLGRNMSGQAIAQLQSQALLPTEEKRQRLHDTKLKQGRIMEMFFRTHYDEDNEFTYTKKQLNEITKKYEDVLEMATFNANNFKEDLFDIVIEVTAGTRSSVSGDIAMLDLALQSGQINFTQYLKLYPSDALSDKTQLIEELESSQSNENMMLKAQLSENQAQLQQSAEVIAKQDEIVKKAVQCIKGYDSLQQLIVKLSAEYSSKIGIANQQLQQANRQIKESENSQSDLFAKSNDMFQKMWGLMSEEERAKAISEMNGIESV